MRARVVFAIILTSTAGVSAQQPDLRTRAEITNYEETSTYADLERIVALGDSLEKTGKQLIAEANAHGGEDNITILLVKRDE